LKKVSSDNVPHLRKKDSATQLIVDGQPFIMLGGQVHNSSSSSLAYMEPIWPQLASLGLNTVFAPVSWELVEPEEGKFSFELVDGSIKGARRHGLRLVFLWFGTWKNAESTYAPSWVKTSLERFHRAQRKPGENTAAISCLSEAACKADARAFVALMQHIRMFDEKEHTVLMMQIENETGLTGTSRDRCPLAEKRFIQQVPAELLQYLDAHLDELVPEMRRFWEDAGHRKAGTWAEVFGAGVGADEVFMAWHVARYVDAVAAAGKAEYPLPMYVNAWLGPQHEGQKPGEYPSGGPVARMMDVWHAAAPHIDFLAPDIYLDDFQRVCREYMHGGNPLMIPEAVRDEWAAANMFFAVGQHDAMCFSPFGIDSIVEPHPLTKSYRLLSEMMPVITKFQGTGRMMGFADDAAYGPGFSISLGPFRGFERELGGYRLQVRLSKLLEKGKVPAAGLVIATADDEYIVAGAGFTLTFAPKQGGLPHVEILAVDEGRFEDGKWVQGRRLNGDESNNCRFVYLGDEPATRKVNVHSYA
jgi:hypothetical protein